MLLLNNHHSVRNNDNDDDDAVQTSDHREEIEISTSYIHSPMRLKSMTRRA